MRTMFGALIGLIALTAPAAAQPPPVKAAYLYCSWPKGQATFKNDFDDAFKALGWQVTKFENTQAGELSERLGEFDIVVGGGVCNLENPQDFSAYAAAWQAFLNRGGVVVATDASYGPTNAQWIGGIDPALKTASATCSAHLKPSAETAAASFAPEDPLLMIPHRLEQSLARKTNWAHLTQAGEGWVAPVTCYDKQPLLAYRTYGKGLVVVTNYFRFTGRPEPGAHLLENALTFARLQQHGLRLSRLAIGPQWGLKDNEIVATVNNVSEQPAQMKLALEAVHGEQTVSPEPVSVTVPPGAEATLSLKFALPARGAYASTLTLSRDGAAALTLQRELVVPELLALHLPRRHQYVSSPLVRVPVALAPELKERLPRLRLTMQAVGPQQSRPITLAPQDLNLEVTVSLKGLPPGDYRLAGALQEDGVKLAAAETPFALHPEPVVRFDERNVCHVRGKPFFPLGMYHVAWRASKDQMLQCLQDLSDLGFNTVHNSCTDPDVYAEVLDRAQALGLMVIPEGVAKRPDVMKRFMTHPAILAWNSGDEPDCHNSPPERVLESIQAVHDVDPAHPCYTTVANPDVLIHYGPVADIFSTDPYPVARGRKDVAAVELNTRRALDAVQGTKPLWIVPQCFGYPDGPWDIPTPAQERAMTYLALIGGANGLIWYVYDDVKFKLMDHPELAAMMKQLTGEIKLLTPALLEGQHAAQRFEAGPEGVIKGSVIRSGSSLYVMTAQTTDKDLGPQELAVPGLKDAATAEVMFENRTVKMAAGKIGDAFGPYAVHVYRVKP